MKNSIGMTSFGQEHSTAFMRAGQIWMTGCQAIGRTVAANSQAHLEQMMSGWKAMSGVKSFEDAVNMQQSLVRTSVESIVATTGTIAGATINLMEESMAPITASMSVAAERLTATPT